MNLKNFNNNIEIFLDKVFNKNVTELYNAVGQKHSFTASITYVLLIPLVLSAVISFAMVVILSTSFLVTGYPVLSFIVLELFFSVIFFSIICESHRKTIDKDTRNRTLKALVNYRIRQKIIILDEEEAEFFVSDPDCLLNYAKTIEQDILRTKISINLSDDYPF